jgi:hypothetical protein
MNYEVEPHGFAIVSRVFRADERREAFALPGELEWHEAA